MMTLPAYCLANSVGGSQIGINNTIDMDQLGAVNNGVPEPSRAGLAAYALLKQRGIDCFVEGPFNGLAEIDLLERTQAALEVLRQIRAMSLAFMLWPLMRRSLVQTRSLPLR